MFQQYTLVVEEYPNIVEYKISEEVFNGGNVTMTCSATEVTDLKLVWYKDGTKLQNTDRTSIIVHQKIYSVLTISYVTLSDQVLAFICHLT